MKNINCKYCSYCDDCYYCSYCNYCISCSYCDDCNSCNYCDDCNSCDDCGYCNYCDDCNYCNYCNYCDYCNYCYYSKGLRMSENMIFCYNNGNYGKGKIGYQSNNCVFNVKVSEKDFIRIKNQITEIFSDLKLQLNENSWSDEWKKVSNEKWIELSKVQHFDKEVVEKIIGFKLILDENVKIEVDGKVVYISKTSAKALNLI